MSRILISIPCLLTGGTEIQTLNLARALAAGGHEVVTACYYEYADDMVRRYRDAGSAVELLAKDGLRRHGRDEWRHLCRGLGECVRKYRPDAVHVQYMAPGATACILLKALGVRRVIATAHTDARIYRSLRLLRFLQRRVLDAFTCITLRAEEEFFGSSRLYEPGMELPRHSHFTIYNSLPGGVELSTRSRSLPEEPVIGVVSRMEGIKGMDLVIPAFARLRETLPHARLLAVGDGSLKESMRRQAAEFGVQGAVEWAGRQPQEKLAAYYDRVSLFWMPSRSEGFGLSALEAMARGCPVIASDAGGLPELVRDGVCGLLAPIGDAGALAERSLRLLSDAGLWLRMSRAARDRAAGFSMERFSFLVNDLYKKILACSS